MFKEDYRLKKNKKSSYKLRLKDFKPFYGLFREYNKRNNNFLEDELKSDKDSKLEKGTNILMMYNSMVLASSLIGIIYIIDKYTCQ